MTSTNIQAPIEPMHISAPENLAAAQVEAWIEANLASRGEDQLRRLSHFWDEAKTGARVILTLWRGDVFCGHVTLLWQSAYTPFRQQTIPEIVDLWVEPPFRQQGMAKQLLTAIEERAKQKGARAVGLGCGITRLFGAAQRLYSTIGYHPDGTGLWVAGRNIVDDGTIFIDDTAMLMLVKKL